jgi:tetratricopeptide (TPR) repeat protein
MANEIDSLLRQAEGLRRAGHAAQAEAAYLGILGRAPDVILAHLGLSEARQALGNFRGSRDAALDAEASLRRTRRWEALPFVTLRLLAFEERDRLRQAILDADWSSPAVLAQSPVLSQHLWLSDAYDDALELVRRASDKVPPNPLLMYSRANALRYSGRLDAATDELERCIALAPSFAPAHWTLAFHRKSDPPGARVDRIRRAGGMLPANDPNHAFLDYALFKELDDAGDTAAAWAALERGMRGKRASIRYDGAAAEAAIAALARDAGDGGVDASAMRPGAGGGAPARAPLFIVGLPRTGTTLMERMLSNHRQVAAGGELADWDQAVNWEIDAFAANPPGLADQARLRAVDAAGLGKRYLARTDALAAGRAFLTDKNPSNLYHAATIARSLPQARIVCLVRDPMDACFSNLKELFPGQGYGYSYDFAEMASRHRGFTALVGALARGLPDRFLAVRYEDLASDPDGVARKVARFCGLGEQAGLADVAANDTPVQTASNAQVRQPVHTGNIGAWRRYERELAPMRALLDAG